MNEFVDMDLTKACVLLECSLEAAGGCLDKMTPSQTPGLPFKQRQMGPNSQTCPHQPYKK